MIYKVFTIYDAKAEAYLPPFYFAATGQAIRAFADMANDYDHQVGRHPTDYTLFELGYFDDTDATFEAHDAKIPLGIALEYAKSMDLRQKDMFRGTGPDNGSGNAEATQDEMSTVPPVSIR